MTSSGFKGMANRSQLGTQALIIRFKFVETTRGFLFFYTCLALFGCSLEEKIYFHPVTLALSCRGSHTHSEQHCSLRSSLMTAAGEWTAAATPLTSGKHDHSRDWEELVGSNARIACPGVTGASPLEGALDSSSFNTFSLEFLKEGIAHSWVSMLLLFPIAGIKMPNKREKWFILTHSSRPQSVMVWKTNHHYICKSVNGNALTHCIVKLIIH